MTICAHCQSELTGKQTFYVDVPSGFNYDRNLSPPMSDNTFGNLKDSETILSKMTGATVKFICNSYADISVGDVYAVTVDSDSEKVLYLLKTGFKLLDSDVVANYYIRKKREQIQGVSRIDDLDIVARGWHGFASR